MLRLSGSLALGIVLAVQASVPAVSSPTWAKPDHFWFRKAVPGGHVWLTVDARHGVKETLFDHGRLAVELSQTTGQAFTALTLPLADRAARFVVKYDGSTFVSHDAALAIEFVLDGDAWRCELQGEWDWGRVPPSDYYCAKQDHDPPPLPTPSGDAVSVPIMPSPDGRWRAAIERHNVVIRRASSAAPVVQTTDGTAAVAYQPWSLQWSADSTTLTGYRVNSQVWLGDSVSGNVAALITRAEWKPR